MFHLISWLEIEVKTFIRATSNMIITVPSSFQDKEFSRQVKSWVRLMKHPNVQAFNMISFATIKETKNERINIICTVVLQSTTPMY